MQQIITLILKNCSLLIIEVKFYHDSRDTHLLIQIITDVIATNKTYLKIVTKQNNFYNFAKILIKQ